MLAAFSVWNSLSWDAYWLLPWLYAHHNMYQTGLHQPDSHISTSSSSPLFSILCLTFSLLVYLGSLTFYCIFLNSFLICLSSNPCPIRLQCKLPKYRGLFHSLLRLNSAWHISLQGLNTDLLTSKAWMSLCSAIRRALLCVPRTGDGFASSHFHFIRQRQARFGFSANGPVHSLW